MEQAAQKQMVPRVEASRLRAKILESDHLWL